PNPRGRGTMDLLFSSVITLLLCVYMSIHLNIAPDYYVFSVKNFGIKRATWDKFKWVLIALVAPEFVLLAAFDQWRNAGALLEALKNIDMTESNPRPNNTDHSRGFAYRREQKFNVPNEELKFPNLILTPKGFLLLAQRKVLHPGILDQESILDRSKADSLAKLLVCAQAFWMVVNVIRRKSSGLPSTLIELHVVTHAIVTVIVYGLWWHKPLGVNNPIIL
ncbi:hypothetical protein FPQ18DRAFT_237787, partial [Pyronema domesticum]